ncbi:MAG: sulfate reduction electron transfer complex DsrMKJOP subunit DsrM [Desulfovibrionaceae bacterium]|nr:sulfate reduction electron transfer complex DsrMKJOP subunit DsrM [Desulfovibrionaceae bacterium]
MFVALLAAATLGLTAWMGAMAGLQPFFGIVLPYAATLIFLAGFIRRVFIWGKSPVPFRIPTVGGQQRSLERIRQNRLDAPYTPLETVCRMVLEVLTFRSLFRNSASRLTEERGLVQWSSKWLWGFALLFHYSFLLIFLRHFRFFLEPVPACLQALETLDGIFQIGVPRFYLSEALLGAALLFLIGRRLRGWLSHISRAADFFPLFLILGLAGSGICLRYFDKTDITSVKVYIMGLTRLHPEIAGEAGPMLYLHLAFLSALLIYFPFSKLMHMGGIFLSPTRNLPNNSRGTRHLNPWNAPSPYRGYKEYEDEFREVMAAAGLPLEKKPEAHA